MNCEISSINKAIEISKPYDTIIVKSGVYYEKIEIKKPLILIGENYPKIGGKDENEIIKVLSDNVKIIGFEFLNSGYSEIYEVSAIKIYASKNCYIENNVLKNNYFGIYLENVKNCIIKNNKIISEKRKSESLMGNGIHAWNSENIIIENNYIEGHRDGIYFEFVQNSIVRNNISKNNIRYGLHFMFSNDDSYIQNKFINNNSGVAVMYSKNIVMEGNEFTENYGISSFGLLLKEISYSKVVSNKFIRNTNAIYMENSNYNEFKGNLFLENSWAIRIMSNCENNNFQYNKFIKNFFEVLTNSTSQFNNVFAYNYWDKYIGYDLNKDGVGDEPYKITSISTIIFEKFKISIILFNGLLMKILDYLEGLLPSFTYPIYDKYPLI